MCLWFSYGFPMVFPLFNPPGLQPPPRLGFRTSARPRSFASLALAGWSARKGSATKGFPAAMVSLRPPKPQWVLGTRPGPVRDPWDGMIKCTSWIHNVYLYTCMYVCIYIHRRFPMNPDGSSFVSMVAICSFPKKQQVRFC